MLKPINQYQTLGNQSSETSTAKLVCRIRFAVLTKKSRLLIRNIQKAGNMQPKNAAWALRPPSAAPCCRGEAHVFQHLHTDQST